MILSTLRTQIKWILAVFLAVFVLSIGLTYDFGSRSDSEGPRDHAVARIDGRELRLSHLYSELRNYLESSGARDIKEEDLPQIYQLILDNMVASKAMDDEVRRLKISPSEEEVEARIKMEEARYITKENFQRTLQLQGVTLDQVRASIAQDLAVAKLMADATAAVTVSDEEVRNFYDAVKDLPFFGLTHAAGIHADVARVKTAAAGEALVQALKDGASWDDAIKALSEEDLISSTPSDNPAHFSESDLEGNYQFIASLADGEVGGPQEMASDNFMVVRRVEAVEESVMAYEEAEPMIRQQLLAERRQEEAARYIEGLVANVKVEILDPDLFPKPAEPAPASEGTPEGAPALAEEHQEGQQPSAPESEAAAPEEGAQTDQGPSETASETEEPGEAAETPNSDGPGEESVGQ